MVLGKLFSKFTFCTCALLPLPFDYQLTFIPPTSLFLTFIQFPSRYCFLQRNATRLDSCSLCLCCILVVCHPSNCTTILLNQSSFPSLSLPSSLIPLYLQTCVAPHVLTSNLNPVVVTVFTRHVILKSSSFMISIHYQKKKK